jgi:hypothetical protein
MDQSHTLSSGVQNQLVELKWRLVGGVLQDARIYAVHRQEGAPDHKATKLSKGDVALAVRKHSGCSWRPPPKKVVGSIAEEINNKPLPIGKAQLVFGAPR